MSIYFYFHHVGGHAFCRGHPFCDRWFPIEKKRTFAMLTSNSNAFVLLETLNWVANALQNVWNNLKFNILIKIWQQLHMRQNVQKRSEGITQMQTNHFINHKKCNHCFYCPYSVNIGALHPSFLWLCSECAFDAESDSWRCIRTPNVCR